MQLRVSIDGVERPLRRIEGIDKGLQDVSPLLMQGGAVLIESSQKNFQEGGRPRWAPLSPTTLLLRARGRSGFRTHKRGENKGRVTKRSFDTYIAGARTLRDSGILMASIGNPSMQGIYLLEKGAVTVGTAVKYARPLHEGVDSTKGFIKGAQIPARAIMQVHPEDEQKIYALAVEFAMKQVRKQ